MRRGLAFLVPCVLLLSAPARADEPPDDAPAAAPRAAASPAPSAAPDEATDSGEARGRPAQKAAPDERKDWARQEGAHLNVGVDLDMSGGARAFPADPGAHEVNVGVMALVAYEFNRLLAVTFRGGYLGSVSYGGSTSKTTSNGFLAPVLVGFRIQLPLSTFRFHLEGALGYAYGNRFSRWVRSGRGASWHQMVADLRFGVAVFLTSYVSVDGALFYRLPNVLVRLVDSEKSDYAHTVGATVGVGFHF